MSKTGSANGSFLGNFIYDQLRGIVPIFSMNSPGAWTLPLSKRP